MHANHTDEGAPTASAPDPEALAQRIAEAQQVLAEATQDRIDACAQELGEVLARHGMRLSVTQPTIILTPTD